MIRMSVTFPAGPISFSDINISLGNNTSTNQLKLSDIYGISINLPSSGTISMSDLRGKTVTIGGASTSASVIIPPQAMTGYTSLLSDGTYNVSVSSCNVNYPGWNAFDNAVAYNQNDWKPANVTNISSYSGGMYTGITQTVTTDATPMTYRGEWVQIQCPFSCRINNYNITCGATTVGGQPQLIRSPGAWYLVGSITGSSWKTIDTYEALGNPPQGWTLFTYGVQQAQIIRENINPNGAMYRYYRLIINKTWTNAGNMSLGEFNLYT